MGEFVATKLVEDTGGFAHVTAAGNARWASFAEAAAANDGVAGILHGGCLPPNPGGGAANWTRTQKGSEADRLSWPGFGSIGAFYVNP